MSRLKAFVKQYILQVVMLAVSVPLLIILVVQYRSLTQLGQTLPIANRDLMRKYLAHLAAKVEDFYKTNSEYALSIPCDVFSDARNQSSMPGIVSYIEQHPAKGAKRVFVAMIEETAAGDIYPSVFFYDPNAEYKFRRERSSPHWRAAHTASGHYLYQAIAKINLDVPPVTVDEQDPEDRVITRPILDVNSIVTGVTGMIIDNAYFKEKLLPELIQDSLETFFPSDYQDIIIILQDGDGNRLFETQPSEGKDFEVAEPLRFLFKDLSFKVVMRSNSVEQSARTVVALNFSLSVIMTGLLIAGIYLALRTASREMRLSRMKSDFVSNVSHELRTPLASIRVFGEFFKSGWVDEPQKSIEYGEYIENESRRLTHLINNILDFSKIESGGKTYDFKKADIEQVVDDTLKAFEARLVQSGFDVVLEAPEKSLPQAIINRDAITQSLVNLIDNAIKYSGPSKKIVIRLGQEEGYITISVTDYGIGIAGDEQQRIFDQFYRVGTGLVHDVKGTGLGLAIVKHIIDAHRGKITVKSQPGSGSTFTMHLPGDDVFGKMIAGMSPR